MIPEAVVAMLAATHLGAVHSVVFGGFAPKECAKRIEAARPTVVLTASCGIEGGTNGSRKILPYLPLVCLPLLLRFFVIGPSGYGGGTELG